MPFDCTSRQWQANLLPEKPSPSAGRQNHRSHLIAGRKRVDGDDTILAAFEPADRLVLVDVRTGVLGGAGDLAHQPRWVNVGIIRIVDRTLHVAGQGWLLTA